MTIQRCEGCDEPEFMCCCSKEFVGQVVSEVYHKGMFVGGKQTVQACFYMVIRPTVIISKRAFILRSPYRHELAGKATESAVASR